MSPIDVQPNPEERLDLLLQHLGASPGGLSAREAARRLSQYGPNEIRRRGRRSHLRDLALQFAHPLALLLWAASILAWVAGIVPIALAIVAVIVVNAGFAFAQELQAERAVEALAAYLPSQAKVLRDGRKRPIATTDSPQQQPVRERADRAQRGALGSSRALMERLIPRCLRVRVHGSECLDLAWLAAGRLDVSVMLSSLPWDVSAGVLIATEAGAEAFDHRGEPWTPDSTVTICCTPGLRGALLTLVQEAVEAAEPSFSGSPGS